jgi:predicted nucleic acid-binding protein
LILVDSFVWVDLFSKVPGPGGRELRRLIAHSEPVAVSGLIVIEVLEGINRDVERIQDWLASGTCLSQQVLRRTEGLLTFPGLHAPAG